MGTKQLDKRFTPEAGGYLYTFATFPTKLQHFVGFSAIKQHLFISHPFEHLLERWLLPIHQNPHAVDLGCNHRDQDKSAVEQQDGEELLPEGNAKGNTHHHHDGGTEGDQ